jgi:RNA polymerase sigma-70 factor (ECF subfamily)
MSNYSNCTNEELFELMASKDEEAIKFIYDKYAPAIYGIILRKVKIRKEAHDILYRTFTKCFKDTFDPRFSTTSMFMYCHNIALSFIKKRNMLYIIRSAVTLPSPALLSVNTPH